MAIKIKCFGWRHPQLDQISRIEKGFLDLGHELVDNNPDLVYSNNDFYDEPIKYARDYPAATVIFNVLDLQLDKGQEWLDKLKNQLLQADVVTCISKTVQKSIWDNLQMKSEVIYNPIKLITYIPDNPRDIFTLFVGRACSPNKRVNEIIRPLYHNLYKYMKDRSVHFVGSENPGFGVWHGIVEDDELNKIYNNSVFGLISSKEEGLNLPLIEMIMGGCLPIICKDMATAEEFGIPELFCEPNAEAMFYKIKEVAQNFPFYNNLCYKKAIIYKEQFSAESVCKRILNLYEQKS